MIVTDSLRAYVLARVEPQPDGCWHWTGARCAPKKGVPVNYGRASHKDLGGSVVAHRVVYELLVGPIPEGLVIDHLCMVRICVNPDHLEAVTQAENVRRQPITIDRMSRTHCPHGHAYDEQNTYRDKWGRSCRRCHADRETARYHRRRAEERMRAQGDQESEVA